MKKIWSVWNTCALFLVNYKVFPKTSPIVHRLMFLTCSMAACCSAVFDRRSFVCCLRHCLMPSLNTFAVNECFIAAFVRYSVLHCVFVFCIVSSRSHPFVCRQHLVVTCVFMMIFVFSACHFCVLCFLITLNFGL